MFRLTNRDRIKFLKERNFELTQVIKELSINNSKIININSSLLKQLELKNNKINKIEKFSKEIIDIWKDTSVSDSNTLMMIYNFNHLIDIIEDN